MENCENLLRLSVLPGALEAVPIEACSACAGDYEDPDRTAWTPDETDEDEVGDAASVRQENFPAER